MNGSLNYRISESAVLLPPVYRARVGTGDLDNISYVRSVASS